MASNANQLTLVEVVSESMVHIIEPIADQVIRFILGKLSVPKEMMDNILIVSDFRDATKTTDDNSNPNLIDYRCVAKLNPSVNPSNIKWEGYKTVNDLTHGKVLVRQEKPEYKRRPWSGHDIVDREMSVFHTTEHSITLTEWNVGSAMTMEVKLDFPSLTDAQETLSSVFATFNAGDMINYIPVQYDYPVPHSQKNVMKYLYSLTCDDPADRTLKGFAQWIHKHSKGTMCWNTNRNDLRAKELVVLRNNSHAMYMIECSQDAPEVGNARYTVNLNITVQYSRTNRLILDYPIVVNNKNVEFRFVPCDDKVRECNQGAFMWQNAWVDAYWHQQYASKGHIALHYPWWDKWKVPSDSIVSLKGFTPIFICAFTLDDDTNPEGETVIDLHEGLPGYHLNDCLKEHLIKGKANCLNHYGTYVNVAVYAHDYQVDKDLLSFDGRYLKIRSRRKNPVYRLVISANPKPLNMNPAAINYAMIATIITKKENA